MALSGATDNEKMRELSSKDYKSQAIWFLNAFWKEFAAQEAENVWKYKHVMQELDTQKGAAGCEVDEMIAHRFLERLNETMTVKALRDRLREKSIDNPRWIALTHYLTIKFDVDYHVLVNAAQGDNEEEIREAQRLLEECVAAFELARRRSDESRVAEAAARQAQQELEAALAELRAQEEAFNKRKEQLQRASETGSVVARNKAKNELAQHLAQDPLPLRRAKINQEAAVKRAEKATAAAAEAARVAEEALDAADNKMREAEAYLQEVKSRPGSAQGALYWIDRELHEAKAFLPQSKGGYRKEK